MICFQKTAQPTSLLASYTSSVLLNSSNQLHCPKCGHISYLSISTTSNQRAWMFCIIGTVLFAITVFGFIFTSLSIIKFGSNLIVRIIIFAGTWLFILFHNNTFQVLYWHRLHFVCALALNLTKTIDESHDESIYEMLKCHRLQSATVDCTCTICSNIQMFTSVHDWFCYTIKSNAVQ